MTSLTKSGTLGNLLGIVGPPLSTIPLSTIMWFGLYFILGYFFYASIFAAAGALVSRVEEVSQVVTVIMMLIIVAFRRLYFFSQSQQCFGGHNIHDSLYRAHGDVCPNCAGQSPPQPGLGFGGDHAGFNLGGYLGFGEDLSCGHLDVRQKAQHPAGIHSSERRGGLKGG